MAKDLSDTLRDALGGVLSDAVKTVGSPQKSKGSPLSGARGVAAGAGLAAAVPLAKKGVDAIRGNGLGLNRVAAKAGDMVGGNVKEAVSGKVDEAGGAGGIAKQAASGLVPGLGGGGGDSGGGKTGAPGVGKGRRMPVQQWVDVAVPLETAYNQWTQFEEWPQFMHRVTRVSQEDDCTVRFATKIWGKTKEFEAKIDTQRPDERIKWRVTQGINHTGVVTFHELAPNLTRIELTFDVDPGSLIEKAARGMRHVKRAARADLHRFKAYIEMRELETGAWRGVIEEGELVEPHDDSYDEERDYSDIEDEYPSGRGDQDEDEDEDREDEEEEQEEDSTSRRRRLRSERAGAPSNDDSEEPEPSERARPRRTGGGMPARAGGQRAGVPGRGSRPGVGNGRGTADRVGSAGRRKAPTRS